MSLRQEWAHLGAFWQEDFRWDVRNCAVSFALVALIGFGAGLALPQVRQATVELFAAALDGKQVVDDAGNLSFVAVLCNNIVACFSTCLYGLIPFAYLPALSLGVNAALLGVLAAIYQTSGLSLGLYFAALLPHGVFELPALVLALSLGLRLCRELTALCRRRSAVPFSQTASDCGRVFLLWVLPLLAAAALVETFVTPRLVGLFA